MGILLCGLNGSGKSTLGRALAEKTGFPFLDNEDLYFPKTDADYPYAVSRSREEVEELLLREIRGRENFIFASVKGDYGEEVVFRFRYAVLVEAPRELRLARVRERSFRKFGDRMLEGGDLYAREQDFFDFVASRAEDTVEEWIKCLHCPVIRVDGTRPVAETVQLILGQIAGEGGCPMSREDEC